MYWRNAPREREYRLEKRFSVLNGISSLAEEGHLVTIQSIKSEDPFFPSFQNGAWTLAERSDANEEEG